MARTLQEAGFTAYFAGGCVRDRLMGNEPDDYDVATDARPPQVSELFRSVRCVGESFGVMLVRKSGHTVEVATFRTDGVYSDNRHPDQVTFSDAEHDARRRDFTINGLFEDPVSGRIIDFVEGQADLQRRVIRAIGDPGARFREDHLRMLRAVRFAARFGFAIEDGTAEAIRAGAANLDGISPERIGLEVQRMLEDANRGVAAWELQYLGLDTAVLQEAGCLNAPTRLGRLPDAAAFATALTAWLLDRHTGDHEEDSDAAELMAHARRWADTLLLSNADRAALQSTLSTYLILRRDWSRLGVARQKRLAASTHFDAALTILQTVDRQEFVDLRRQIQQLAESGGLAPEPLITGDDLIAIGLEPGPEFKRLLEAVYDAQLEGALGSRDAAIELARALAPGALDEDAGPG